MPTYLTNTSIVFNDGTVQSTAVTSIVPSSITAVGSVILAAVNTTSNIAPGSTVFGSNVYIPNAVYSWAGFNTTVYSSADTSWSIIANTGNIARALRTVTGNTGYLTPTGATVGSGTWRTLWFTSARTSNYDSCSDATFSYTAVTLLVRIS